MSCAILSLSSWAMAVKRSLTNSTESFVVNTFFPFNCFNSIKSKNSNFISDGTEIPVNWATLSANFGKIVFDNTSISSNLIAVGSACLALERDFVISFSSFISTES